MLINNYIHCGNCWGVLGEVQTSTLREMVFDTADCGWECNCGRYNLSSDGMYDIIDDEGNNHLVYVRGDKERKRLTHYPLNYKMFIFPFTNSHWNP